MKRRVSIRHAVWLVAGLQAALGAPLLAEQTPPVSTPAPTAAPSPTRASAPDTPMKQEELEQILAPLALYPDSLLAQVLMASTYPIEVVQADRWVKANANLKGDALATELEKQTWDPSVKSLVNFPQVLTMMSEKLDQTVKVGDAFIADQGRVMNTVQALRAKAQAQGNLQSNTQQVVTVQPAPAPVSPVSGPAPTQIIQIEPANPQVIYVPTYDPTVVYGYWPYPAYPPYYYYPPGYTAGRTALAFGAGVAIGLAWGYAWGGCNWGHHDVDIDINRNINVNNTHIDRNRYESNFNRTNNFQSGRGSFQHDPVHRQGVAYRDQATAQRFGGVSNNQAAQARDAYRGRADAGRQDLARGGADQFRGSGDFNRSSNSGAQNRGNANPGNRAPDRSPAPAPSRSTGGAGGGAFDGVDRGGNSARNYSQRGQSSRAAPSRGGGGGGGFHGGGGGGRGGGGRR